MEQGILPGVKMDDLQFAMFEYHWFLPTLLSTFSHRTFCKLLTAVLLERSIVFVDDNLPLLTSIVMSLKTLIRPFNWCGSLVPIMPSGLQETIFSPFSVLIGITSLDYEQLLMNTSQEDRQEITWIFLNASDSEAYLELDESFSENKENIERDKEALIIWSILDGDLLEEERSKLLLGWCGEFYKETKPYFDTFIQSAARDYSS